MDNCMHTKIFTFYELHGGLYRQFLHWLTRRGIGYCKSLIFRVGFISQVPRMNNFREIKYHAKIFRAQTIWQCIITMTNVTISCHHTTLSVT